MLASRKKYNLFSIYLNHIKVQWPDNAIKVIINSHMSSISKLHKLGNMK